MAVDSRSGLQAGFLWLVSSLALAQEPAVQPTEEPAESAAEDLARQATDPTAALMSFGFVGDYTGGFHGQQPGLDDDATVLSFRPAIPYTMFGGNHILRITLPYHVSGRGDDGLQDVSLFDILTFDRKWGRLAAGLVMSFATADEAPDDFAIGPALGFVKPMSKKLNVGAFTQNLFADDTAISQIQPVIAYQLGKGWSISAGDAQFIYDWKASRWLLVPLSFQVGRVTKLGSQPIRWSINPQYNLADDPGFPEWSLKFNFSVLVPGK